MKKGLVIIQDKNYSSVLPTKQIEDCVAKFKIVYREYLGHSSKKVIGFELNGGEGMYRPGLKVWNEFIKWCQEKGMNAIYNTSDEVTVIRDNLRYRVDNKNSY